MKSAAAAWLQSRGQRARFDYARPGSVPVGSVVDIVWEHGGGALRVHLDSVVPPVWDGDAEPVLGMSVPVDRDTLVRRWYGHRVRLDTEGTVRRVRIGTEAFARDTEWFALEDCEMTPRGLRTPAVERIVRARSKPPPRRTVTGRQVPHGEPTVPVPSEERDLVRLLAGALRAGSVTAVAALCREIADAGPARSAAGGELTAVLEEARLWLDQQSELQGKLFGSLQAAVSSRSASKVGTLLARADASAGHDRSKEEDAIAHAAVAFLEDLKRSARWEKRDAAPPVRGPKRLPRRQPSQKKSPQMVAHRRMRDILSDLRRLSDRLSARERSQLLSSLSKATAAAGDEVTPHQRHEVADWMAREGSRSRPAAAKTKQPSLPESRHPAKQRHPDRGRVGDAPRPAAAGRGGNKGQRKPAGTPRLPAGSVAEVGAAVRGALKKAARERSTTSWARLRRQLGGALPPLHPDDELEVLVWVDQQTPTDEPALSSLIAVNDTSSPVRLYRRLASR
ncbi:hypothetical protein [Streptomyces sp. H27-D2]|uniref:hypothetical protein n=1 Tax=Streptomyces sp. H27-D2 TaxID=3046304 RepID=UPI002DB6401A|nr:hypothetical protein [Streptomyces sp. H27-D2]MEC4019832.1 hypothetical protein [Streptomyces sp. H27-D2]